MKNPLMQPPLTRIAFTLTLCPNQQKSRMRHLQAQLASAVKQLAFVESQLARELKALLKT